MTQGLPSLPALPDGPETLGIYDVAQALNLKVVRTNPTYFTLKGNYDSVMIFTYEGSQFYVNGTPAGDVGPVVRNGEATLFNRTLVDRIRPHLGQTPAVARKSTRRAPTLQGTIVIDPGHGGHDPGATSVLGYEEKTINLKVARELASILKEQGFRVILTRNSDVYPELEERAAIANRVGANLFVSVHADSNPSPDINGFTVFVARAASNQSRQAADKIMHSMRSTGISSRGVREADYRVLVQTRCPAVLVELGHLSNHWEASRLRDAEMQQRLAQAIARGTASLWADAGSSGRGDAVVHFGK